MTHEELEKIKTKKDKSIHIIQFVKLSEINMIYYEKTIMPYQKPGRKRLMSSFARHFCSSVKRLLQKR